MTADELGITELQRENLLKLAGYLERLPPDSGFDMENFAELDLDQIGDGWSKHVEGIGAVNCGTAGCAVGHGPYAGIPKHPKESWVQYWQITAEWRLREVAYLREAVERAQENFAFIASRLGYQNIAIVEVESIARSQAAHLKMTLDASAVRVQRSQRGKVGTAVEALKLISRYVANNGDKWAGDMAKKALAEMGEPL